MVHVTQVLDCACQKMPFHGAGFRGYSRSFLRFRINSCIIVERKRLSRGAVTGGSPVVFGFLTAYGHARGRYIYLDMKGLCLGWPIPWVVSGRAIRLTSSGTPGNDAAKNRSYLKSSNCFVCFLYGCNLAIVLCFHRTAFMLELVLVFIC